MSMLTLFLTLLFTPLLSNGQCVLKNQDDKKSATLLERIQELNGQTFTATYVDSVVSDKYDYAFTVCGGVQLDDYHSSHFGVVQKDKTRYIGIGSINSTIIKGGTDWIMLTYTNGQHYRSHCSQSSRQAHIMIVCDPNNLKGDFTVLYENNLEDNGSDCFYMMELASKVACTSLNTGLSSGSLFLIVLFSVCGAYLLFGAVYKRCVYGSKGVDQVPNIGFWKTCGSLQADGCTYLCKCSGSGYNSNQPYEGIADDQLEEEIDDEHLLPM